MYEVKFWGTTLLKHAEEMERLQHYVTKLSAKFRNTPYMSAHLMAIIYTPGTTERVPDVN